MTGAKMPTKDEAKLMLVVLCQIANDLGISYGDVSVKIHHSYFDLKHAAKARNSIDRLAYAERAIDALGLKTGEQP